MNKYANEPFLTSDFDCDYCIENKAFMNLLNGKKICPDCWVLNKDKDKEGDN